MTEIEIELEDDVVEALVKEGFARQVLVLTDKGNEWLRAYCEEKLKEEK